VGHYTQQAPTGSTASPASSSDRHLHPGRLDLASDRLDRGGADPDSWSILDLRRIQKEEWVDIRSTSTGIRCPAQGIRRARSGDGVAR